MLYANHQQIWLIALPVAQPPPIRLVPLHPNTMGDAANIRFCQSHRWGQVIEGGSADVTKKRFFTHDNQLGCGSLHRQWRCHPQFPPPSHRGVLAILLPLQIWPSSHKTHCWLYYLATLSLHKNIPPPPTPQQPT